MEVSVGWDERKAQKRGTHGFIIIIIIIPINIFIYLFTFLFIRAHNFFCLNKNQIFKKTD